jgi:hypothetical protein
MPGMVVFQMAEVALPRELVPGHSGRDWAAEVAHTDGGADACRAEIAGRRSAGGDALSAFGRKSVLKAIEGRSHLPQSQESGRAQLDTTVIFSLSANNVGGVGVGGGGTWRPIRSWNREKA